MDAIYSSIGHFIVAFSGVVDWMEHAIVMTAPGGQQRATHALLAELTADPLVKAWRSVMIETYGTESGSGAEYMKRLAPADAFILGELVAEVNELIEIRNDLVHGRWLVGWGNEQTTDWSEASLVRKKNLKAGIGFVAGALAPALWGSPTASTIDRYTVRAEVLADAILRFSSALLWNAAVPNKGPRDRRVRIGGKGKARVIYTSLDGVEWQGSDGTTTTSPPPIPVTSS